MPRYLSLLFASFSLLLSLFFVDISHAQQNSCGQPPRGFNYNNAVQVYPSSNQDARNLPDRNPRGQIICIPTQNQNDPISLNSIYSNFDNTYGTGVLTQERANRSSATKQEFVPCGLNPQWLAKGNGSRSISFNPYKRTAQYNCGLQPVTDDLFTRYIVTTGRFTESPVYIYFIGQVINQAVIDAQNITPTTRQQCDAIESRNPQIRECENFGTQADEDACYATKLRTCLEACPNCGPTFAELGGPPENYNGPLPDCAFRNGGCRSINDVVEVGIRVARMIFQFLGTVAFVMFVIGGGMMIFAAGNPQRFQQGTKVLVAAVIGVAIALTAFIGVEFVLDVLGVSSDFRPGI